MIPGGYHLKEHFQNYKFDEFPFKHWVIDDALPSQMAQQLFKDALTVSSNKQKLYKYDNIFERKYATDKWDVFPDGTKHFLSWTLCSPFVKKIEEMTGIKGLIPDWSFTGGGYHFHTFDGVLKSHKDFSLHRNLGLIRRLNFIVYLNKNYQPSWGGQLELHDSSLSFFKEIEPIFNRAVLFETPGNIHGFNKPWRAPDGIERKSIAIYLYTAPTREDFDKEHLSTQFVKLPNEPTNDEIEKLREQRNKGRLTTNIT